MKNVSSEMYAIAQNIKKYRKLHKMTQEMLATQLELDTQYYAQLERGERNFTLDKILRICDIYEIGIDHLIEIEPKMSVGDYEKMKAQINEAMQGMTYNQLAVVDKFIKEIVDYIK